MKVAFQMEPLDGVDLKLNNSVMLMAEAARRKYTIYHYTPDKLSLKNGKAIARACKVKIDMSRKKFFELGKEEELDLIEIDAVQMRNDPPFDMHYVTATHILERIHPKTLVVNDPFWVRNSPEKLFTFDLAEFIPPTLISQDISEIRKFLKEQKEIILKPLYAMGGRGVVKVNQNNQSNLETAVQSLIELYSAPLVAQKFFPQIKEGDKRVVLINGEIAGTFLKIPAKNSFLANITAGAKFAKAKLTKREEEICAALKTKLKKRGLVFTAIDTIGGYLTEINVTSPAGLGELDELYGSKPWQTYWNVVENKL